MKQVLSQVALQELQSGICFGVSLPSNMELLAAIYIIIFAIRFITGV